MHLGSTKTQHEPVQSRAVNDNPLISGPIWQDLDRLCRRHRITRDDFLLVAMLFWLSRREGEQTQGRAQRMPQTNPKTETHKR